MRYLVTGATGFLGRHLLGALRATHPEARIAVLVRDRKTWDCLDWAQLVDEVEVIEGSVQAPDAWRDPTPGVPLGGIFHLAALVRHSRREAQEVFDTNVVGTQSMVRLSAAHGCRLVYVSTSGTVGCTKKPGLHAAEDAPFCEREVQRWPYYASKIAAEKAARTLACKLGADVVILRPPVMLGPGDHRFRATSQVLRYLNGRLPFLVRGGIHYVDIRDAAAAMVAAMDHHAPRPVYNLPGTVCSIGHFFGDVAKVAGRPSPRLFLPYRLAWLLSRADEWLGLCTRGKPFSILPDPVVIEMASRHWDVASKHAAEDLAFVPRDGVQTLSDTVQWLAAHAPTCGSRRRRSVARRH